MKYNIELDHDQVRKIMKYNIELDHDQTDAIVIASLKEAYRLNADPLPDEGGEKWVDVEFLAAIDHVLEYYHNYEQKKLWIVEKESFNNGKSNK